MALSTGSRLGSHEIVSLLGAGGMGEVYLALDTKLNRRVAIKVLPDAYAADPERIARFQREAQAVAALNHVNIAAIYDLAEADSVLYFVLELVEGDTLADRIGRGPVPVEEALQIAKQILEALEVAHEKGICHRDLKPANVKLTADGSIKVLDFGLAKFLQTDRSPAHLTHSPTLTLAATIPGVVLGTAGYMSPEQAKGFEADQRSDIFSFGCILYELLTGRRAFEGDTVSETLASVLKSDVDFTALPKQLNPRVVELLRRCLEKNPKKRWYAAGDVRIEIENLIGHGVAVEVTQPAAVARKQPRWKLATALAGAALLGGILAGYLAWTMKPEPLKQVTRFSVTLSEGLVFSGSGRQLIALSPDGTALVFGANSRLYLRSLSELNERAIPGSEDPSNVMQPAFSPDGKSLVFFSVSDRTLNRIDVSGGAAVMLCALDGNPFGLNWTDDGIVFSMPAKGILRLSPRGGTPEVVVAASADEVMSNPQLLPGARAVLYSLGAPSASWDKASVVVQPIGGGRKTLIDGGADGRYLPTGHLVYALAGVLLAVPFDLASLSVTGGAVPVVEGVRRTNTRTDGSATAQFTFSSTGTLAYLPGPVSNASDGTTLAIFDRTGQPRPLKLPPASYSAPRASPDGKRIVFERADPREASVWTYDLSGTSAPQRLTFGGNNRAPIWSPDGQWVAFQSDREGDPAIYRQRADGTGVADRMTKPLAGIAHLPQSWSKDERLLLSVHKSTTDSTLWIRERDGQLTAYGDMQAREAMFSPDGRWIAFQSPNAVIRDVYVAQLPWTGIRALAPHVNSGGGQPFWTAKGDAIIMNTGQQSSTIVSVATAAGVVFGQPAEFPRTGRVDPNPAIGRRNTDPLPDDEHFISVYQPLFTQAQMGQVVVVLNWFDQVREKSKTN